MIRRAAVIGCGYIGATAPGSHCEAYSACRRTELVAVCDADAARLHASADRWNVPARFADPAELLSAARPELVSICTPDETHAALVRQALLATGVRAVLAEKPIALTARESDELVALAHERGVLLAVNYTRRWATGIARLKRRIAAGELGRIERVAGTYTKGVLHNGSHWFDLARWLVGEVESVQAWRARGSMAADPELDVRLEFAGGAVGFLTSMPHQAYAVFEMELSGTAGRARIVDAGHRIETSEVADSPHYPGFRALTRERKMAGGMSGALLRAVEDLARGRTRCAGADAAAAVRIATRAIAAVEP